MVQRWAQRNNVEDVEMIQRRLATIDAMVARLDEELDALAEAPGPDGPPAPSSNGHRDG